MGHDFSDKKIFTRRTKAKENKKEVIKLNNSESFGELKERFVEWQKRDAEATANREQALNNFKEDAQKQYEEINSTSDIDLLKNRKAILISRVRAIEAILDNEDEPDAVEYEKLLSEYNKWLSDVDVYIDCAPKQDNNSFSSPDRSIRCIDRDNLGLYFTPTFKGKGNGAIDYFTMMVDELKTDRSAKAFAQIALMIYDGGNMNDRKPSTFSRWYKIFCNCIGCVHATYQRKDLRTPPTKLKRLFSYL